MAQMLAARAKTHVGRSARPLMVICAAVLSSTSALAQTAPPTPPPTPVAFEQAFQKAANDLFSKANLEGAPAKVRLVIDPLIDGFTGAQSRATRSMEQRIAELVRTSYPRFEVAPFSAASIADLPVVLVGTFTAINNAGVAGGPRDAYRICLTLADLKTRKIVSKGVARAQPEGIDTTPTAFFARQSRLHQGRSHRRLHQDLSRDAPGRSHRPNLCRWPRGGRSRQRRDPGLRRQEIQ